MANLRGKGAMTDVNLIAVSYDKAESETSKWVDVQIDHRDKRAQGQSNLHLYGKPEQKQDGSPGWTNNQPYSIDKQWNKMLEAADENVAPKRDIEGNIVGKVIAFKASLMNADNPREGAIVRTNKEIKPSDFKVDEKTLDAQYASMTAAKEAKEAQAEQQTEAPQAQAEAPAQEAQAEEPSPVG